MTRTLLVRALPLLLVAPLLVLLAHPAFAATRTVTMDDFAFSPTSLSVQTGDTVTWVNKDTAPHDVTVTSGPTAVKSPMLTTGQSWKYTFKTAGKYLYTCSIHPQMRASVTVAATAAATTPAKTTTTAGTPGTSGMVADASMSQPATAAAPQAGARGLNPNLLVAGIVVGVATLCLLLLGSSSMVGYTTGVHQQRMLPRRPYGPGE
jgi:plastocyanin